MVAKLQNGSSILQLYYLLFELTGEVITGIQQIGHRKCHTVGSILVLG